jgi:hypothetical protein
MVTSERLPTGDYQLEGLITEAVLQLADSPIIGHASRFAHRFDIYLLCAGPVIVHLEHMRLPAPVVRLGDDPEPSGADVDFAGHAVSICFGRSSLTPHARIYRRLLY